MARLDGSETAECQEHACGHIRDRNRQSVRWAIGRATRAHEPGHALRHQIEATSSGIRAGLAETRDCRIVEARIALSQNLVAEPQLAERARAKADEANGIRPRKPRRMDKTRRNALKRAAAMATPYRGKSNGR